MTLITKPFDDDPLTKTHETFHYDPDTGDFWIETKTDVEEAAVLSKAQFADTDERARWSGDINHVARIPLIFFDMHPELMYDNEALRKWLNNPDNRSFRSRPGRI